MRGPDAAVARRAMGRLARDPARALGAAKGLAPVDGAAVSRLVAGLGAEAFADRRKAYEALAAMGRFIEGPLEAALGRGPPAQVKADVERLLDACAGEGPTAEHRRALLAVEMLDAVGGAEAAAALRRLAGGDKDAELTRRARAALGRVKG